MMTAVDSLEDRHVIGEQLKWNDTENPLGGNKNISSVEVKLFVTTSVGMTPT